MPCYDPRSKPGYQEPEIRYVSGIDPQRLKDEENTRAYIEAAFCAVMNEIESRGIAQDVLAKASRNGRIDVMWLWNNHRLDDEKRLSSKLHKEYSVDEQKVLFKLLKQQLESKS